MMKFIKEIFSVENIKKGLVYGALANPNISVSEIIHLTNVLRDMDAKSVNKSIDKKVNIKKAA